MIEKARILVSQFSLLKRLLRNLRLMLNGQFPPRIAEITLRIQSQRESSLEGLILKKILKDRDPILTTFADKIAVRNYVSETIGRIHLPEMIASVSKGQTIPWDILPREFVMKSAHASGGAVLVTEMAPRKKLKALDARNWAKILVHPEDIDKDKIEAFFNKLLKMNYANYPGFHEYAYANIPPAILIEEFMYDENKSVPNDFKFWCLNGKVIFVQVDAQRFESHKRNFYDSNWNNLDVELTFPRTLDPIAAPKDLAKMIEIAEKLSAGSQIIRVDLYQLENQVMFGELTNYPGGGIELFRPRSFSEGYLKEL